MLRLPPTPALFPYTTLFRSFQRQVGAELGHLFVGAPQGEVQEAERIENGLRRVPERLQQHLERGLRRLRDRKSTRLNSSHPSISYAVFCLKKKTRTQVGQHL